MVINHAEVTKNCEARKKFGITGGNVCRWRQMKDNVINVNSYQKEFMGTKKGCLHELEQCIIEYVRRRFPSNVGNYMHEGTGTIVSNARIQIYNQVQRQ